jgi:hypothetical protein
MTKEEAIKIMLNGGVVHCYPGQPMKYDGKDFIQFNKYTFNTICRGVSGMREDGYTLVKEKLYKWVLMNIKSSELIISDNYYSEEDVIIKPGYIVIGKIPFSEITIGDL